MTFEIFLYRAQVFAVSLQGAKPGSFMANLKIGLGALITQTLMGIAFARCYSQGEVAYRKQQLQKRRKQNG